MRKDYINFGQGQEDEATFVEDFWTKVWEKEGGPQGKIERIGRQEEYRLMRIYLESLPDRAKILDAGCGLGDWVLYLKNLKYDITGIDISRRTVELLKDRFPDVNFVTGDIRDTSYEDESFDAYFSWGVFEHFENGPQDCIKEAWRILKPGGVLFISVPLDNVRQSLRGVSAKPQEADPNMHFYQYRFTRAELAHELSVGGFEFESFHPIHKRQGILRSLHHEFKLPYEWLFTRGLSVVLAPFIPGWWIAHMVMAIARKPE